MIKAFCLDMLFGYVDYIYVEYIESGSQSFAQVCGGG